MRSSVLVLGSKEEAEEAEAEQDLQIAFRLLIDTKEVSTGGILSGGSPWRVASGVRLAYDKLG